MFRRTSVLILICLIFIFSGIPTFAATVPSPDAEINAENYRSASAKLSITNSTATVSATIIGVTGKTTKTSIYLYLQQYKGGTWVNLESWSSVGNTVTRTLSKTKVVSKGYKYRTKAVCRAYVGSTVETITKYSASITC